MNRRFSLLAILLAVAVMFAMVPMSSADTITPGQTTTNLTPSSAGDASVTELASLTGTFAGAITGHPSGTYTAQVWTNSNGGLNFVYFFSNTGTADTVESVTMSDFTGFTTDVFDSGSGVAATSASSSGASPNDIKFFFGTNGVGIGQSSETLTIATNAKTFEQGVFSLQDGATATVLAFQPAPEPGSMLLFGTGLSGVAAMLRRRVKKQ